MDREGPFGVGCAELTRQRDRERGGTTMSPLPPLSSSSLFRANIVKGKGWVLPSQLPFFAAGNKSRHKEEEEEFSLSLFSGNILPVNPHL